jgi:hypothetical protein
MDSKKHQSLPGQKRRKQTMKLALYFLIFSVLVGVKCVGQTKKSEESVASAIPKLEQMPELLEISFALSAAPPHLRNNATTYLLDPVKGYVLKHKGTNGVSCIVVRSDWQFPSAAFRDDIFWAVCYDSEGSKTLLQDYMYAAELRARGMDVKQVHNEVTSRLGSPAYPNPSRTGIGYMTAPVMRGLVRSGVATMNMPHYMFYAPNLKDADIGGNGFSKQYPFMLSMSPGRDDYIILLVGEAEKEKIISDSKDLLAGLCSYRDYLCTTGETRARTPFD